MPAVLRILDGPQAGTSCELRVNQRAVLGRGEESDLNILDSWASRAHCAVTYSPDHGLLLEDLESKNGTYIAGQRVASARLKDGSLIQIGTTTVQVLVRPTSSTVAVPAVLPPRRRAARAGAIAGVAGLLLVGLVYGGLVIFGHGSPPTAKRPTTGVRWVESPKSPPRSGFSIFGGGPRKVTISITSEPPGATVFLDEEFYGATPLGEVEVTTGDHTLRVQKAGYAVYREPLTVGTRAPKTVQVALKLAERASLIVNSKPDGASVLLDDDYRGKTPLRLDDLDPHTYSLRIQKPNFADWHKEVTLAANQVVTIEAALSQREIAYYVEQLKTDPNNVSYHTELAHLYLLEQKVDACIEQLTQAMEITLAGRDTTRPEPYTRRLVWLIEKIYFNDYFYYGDDTFVQNVRDRIDTMLADTAAQHPSDSTVIALARALSKRAGNPQRTLAAYLKQIEAQPTELNHYLNAVRLLQIAGEHQRAEGLLQNAAKAIPNDYRVSLALGRLYLHARRDGLAGASEKARQALIVALNQCQDEAAKKEISKLLAHATR